MKKEHHKELIVAVSGYFDPLHIGHLEYFQLAKLDPATQTFIKETFKDLPEELLEAQCDFMYLSLIHI